MSYVFWKLERTPVDNNGGWIGTPVEITTFSRPLVRVALGDIKDSFSFDITNFYGAYNNVIQPNDKITIYRCTNHTTPTSADIIMIGIARAVPITETFSSNVLKVSGYNFSEALAGAIIFVDLNNVTIPVGIKACIDNAGAKNANFAVTWKSTNPTLKKNGSAFPTISEERWFNKPLLKVIEKYSSNDRTKDDAYFWYINNSNEFVWKPEKSNINYTFNYTTDTTKGISIKKDLNGIKNYIILKGGFDPAGDQIQDKYVEWTSVAKHGIKYYFHVSETSAAKNLVQLDIRKSFGDDFSTDGYPDLTASFTTAWKSLFEYTTTKYGIVVNENTITINEGSESDNKKAYNEVIREETKLRLKSEGATIAYNNQYGKLLVDLTFSAGERTWNLGDNIDCNIPQISETTKILRVKEIMFGADTDVFTLAEDIGSL